MAGIYIHVPFCKTRCIYCDFFTQTSLTPKSGYVSAICKEMGLRREYIGNEPVETIYFGGGTPSLLSIEDFRHIFDTLYNTFEIKEDAEITLEANPDDLNDEYIAALISLPFNRISIGIQSFDDDELKFLKRRHSAHKAKEAVKEAQRAGFDNISIDLMYGLPGQTIGTWEKNIEEAIALDIQHISSYHLIYEEGTKLYRLFKQGDVKAVDEEISVEMFSVMIDRLNEAGFIHYEISNFAKKGFYSKHNSSYWTGKKYLGLGTAAHSFDGNNRAWNVASIPKYIHAVEKGMPEVEIEYLDEKARYNDFILTGMRTMWGIDLTELEKRFGKNMKDYCMKNTQRYIDQEFVIFSDDVLKLTREGIFISDGIMSDLMWIG